jgi:pyruvate,water dikinase
MSSPARTTAGFTRPFDTLSSDDVALVGGKNASLGELISALKEAGVRVPDGFATTAEAYWRFLDANDLRAPIARALEALDRGERSLAETGRSIRERIRGGAFPDDIAASITAAYHDLSERALSGRTLSGRAATDALAVAARSSATAEDLPEASFAGQQETYLNVRGAEAVLDACRRCFASLFTDRAISYRVHQGFEHMQVALSVGVQAMVRADKSGVLFTLDTDSGFPDVALINATWGLGELVVQGAVTPDQVVVFTPLLDDARAFVPIIGRERGSKARKMVYAEAAGGAARGAGDEADGAGVDPAATTRVVETTPEEQEAFVLSDDEALTLARWGAAIEAHYGRPMDVEWARDGDTEELFVLQARPETVQSRQATETLRTYRLTETGEPRVTGLSVGQAIATGEVCVLESAAEIDRFREGAILVTGTTDPDWGPILKQAAGVVTDHGGRTSHAAIVSRELGIPAVVGTGTATEALRDGEAVTLSCAEGETGTVYAGTLAYETIEIRLDEVPETETAIMMNVASPAAAMRWWALPADGIGLARMEYIVNSVIQVHPMALVDLDRVEDAEARERIEALTRGYDERREYFVDHLARGIGTIAASQYPDPVIVRTSDFKTNEYANLIGGAAFEPHEENPMLGWRGASRYYSDDYRAGFALECEALRRVRDEMGFANVVVMIPFCRTPEEADRVLAVMAEHGLERGANRLKVYVMAELPSNILRAEAFAERFDGFSIGTNDLTQLALGVDRDSERLAGLFDERDPTVTAMIRRLIEAAHAAGRPVGICGQAPSDHPDYAAFLVDAGIDSISVIPDTVVDVLRHTAEAEAARKT